MITICNGVRRDGWVVHSGWYGHREEDMEGAPNFIHDDPLSGTRYIPKQLLCHVTIVILECILKHSRH